MATTSPIYGWPEPTSSDFVTNGATAITAMGNAIENTVYANQLIVEAILNPFLLMGA
jgi:hypothetical protein